MSQETPLSNELSIQLSHLSPTQLAWLSGYCWAKSQNSTSVSIEDLTNSTDSNLNRKITILSASQTGNAKHIAETLHQQLQKAGVTAHLTNAADFKSKTLADEDILLLVTSTQGEGEPPEEALPLYKFLQSKKAPNLSKLTFAVLALGDSSYPQFCQAGKDFDTKFVELGATRLADITLCDLEFQAAADAWLAYIIPQIVSVYSIKNTTSKTITSSTNHSVVHQQQYNKENPYHASLSARQKITSNQAEKDVAHIEIDLTASGIQYQAGDALGIWPINSPQLIDEILKIHQLNGNEIIQLSDGKNIDIRTALAEFANITQNTPSLIQQYAAHTNHTALQNLISNKTELNTYLASTPPIGVFTQYPYPLSAQDLFQLFRPQTPRLYSISSAQDEVGDEVHLTVGLIQFEHHQKNYTGAASGFINKQLKEGEKVRIFIEPNPNFRLPSAPNTPIIMIGAGTGIAPFRAFMQQRSANQDTGKNWLFFGNQKLADDFLYQLEWQQWHKEGLLTHADLAWSQQGKEKVYVQDKLSQNAVELWDWLQKGAHIYVCGNASHMAKDVETTLIDIISQQGKLSLEEAEEYLTQLREEKRYQRDVY